MYYIQFPRYDSNLVWIYEWEVIFDENDTQTEWKFIVSFHWLKMHYQVCLMCGWKRSTRRSSECLALIFVVFFCWYQEYSERYLYLKLISCDHVWGFCIFFSEVACFVFIFSRLLSFPKKKRYLLVQFYLDALVHFVKCFHAIFFFSWFNRPDTPLPPPPIFNLNPFIFLLLYYRFLYR